MADENVITITRTGQIVKHKHKGQYEYGEISTLKVNGMATQYFAVERRRGYVTLPPGTYTLEMEISPKHAPRKQFRVKGHNVHTKDGGLAAILMHEGNYPGNVSGCIAPGKIQLPDGVGQSEVAMSEIFTQFGGFVPGTKAKLVVVGTQVMVK
jgi:hypothetical protein